MAKEIKEQQTDLFYEPPKVAGLGITKFEISGAGVKAVVEGVTNTNDIALLDNPCWQKAVSAWALSLHGGDIDKAITSMKKAYVDHINATAEPHRPTVDDFYDAQHEEHLRSIEQLEKQNNLALNMALSTPIAEVLVHPEPAKKTDAKDDVKALDAAINTLEDVVAEHSKKNGKGKANVPGTALQS